MYRNPIIVQLSDLHFGQDVRPYKRWKPSADESAKLALRQAIMRMDPRPDFIVVTGDVANQGKLKEMQEGRAYLDSLLSALLQEKHVARCIVVPGNHDVWLTTWFHPFRSVWRGANRLTDWNKVFAGGSFLPPGLADDEAAELRPLSLKNYYERRATGNDQRRQREAAFGVAKAESVCEFFPEFGVAFLKIDSNIKNNRRPGHIARGYVGLRQRDEIESVVRDYERADPRFAAARRIALIHHHLTRLPNVTQDNWMLMDDGGEVARWLARLDVRLVLHGHYHQPDIVGLSYWNTDAGNSKAETVVVSAGSATALDVGRAGNSFHHVSLDRFRTTIRRPYLEAGEPEALAAALSFKFEHRPNLALDATASKAPIFLEALSASLMEEEKYADREHVYSSLKLTGYIDDTRSYFGSVELEGTNASVSDRQTNFIPIAFTAVGSQYFEETGCHAIDLVSGQRLADPILLQDRPINVFPAHVNFAGPLNAGKSFKIRVNFMLKMVMLEENDYDMMNLLRFPRGVARAEMCLLSQKKIVAPTLWELHGDRLIRSGIGLEPVRLAPANPGTAGERTGFRAVIDAPPALAYMLCYEKLD